MTSPTNFESTPRGNFTCTSKSFRLGYELYFSKSAFTWSCIELPLSYRFSLWKLGKKAATFADQCSSVEIIAQHISEALFDESIGTGLLLYFYEDDIVIPYQTYDQYFAGYDQLLLPLSARHLSALHTFPSSVEDFLREHFRDLDLPPTN
jgi:hypothetical protein